MGPRPDGAKGSEAGKQEGGGLDGVCERNGLTRDFHRQNSRGGGSRTAKGVFFVFKGGCVKSPDLNDGGGATRCRDVALIRGTNG